jgi:hypothetical protein
MTVQLGKGEETIPAIWSCTAGRHCKGRFQVKEKVGHCSGCHPGARRLLCAAFRNAQGAHSNYRSRKEFSLFTPALPVNTGTWFT